MTKPEDINSNRQLVKRYFKEIHEYIPLFKRLGVKHLRVKYWKGKETYVVDDTTCEPEEVTEDIPVRVLDLCKRIAYIYLNEKHYTKGLVAEEGSLGELRVLFKSKDELMLSLRHKTHPKSRKVLLYNSYLG